MLLWRNIHKVEYQVIKAPIEVPGNILALAFN